MRLGFRSSFNFIPEGPYSVPASLRSWLTERGFEVGVHDLEHNGKLYSSREQFRSNAQRINNYLEDWKAVGFRSGFMLRNLDWLCDLNLEYESSTFDTDPFEPQPDGCNTIFPFWVSASAGDRPSAVTGHCRGYVEMPYTLPQDSTLFLIFEEQTNEIWKRKLDWVAEHAGMASVIVHPDYIDFKNSSKRDLEFEYPVRFYEEFLSYVQQKYDGQFWHAVSKDVATHARTVFIENSQITGAGARPTPAPQASAIFRPSNRAPKPTSVPFGTAPAIGLVNQPARARILMLVENNYPQDTRVRNEASLLASSGYQVTVICLKRPGQAATEIVGGVQVYRLPTLELFKKTPSANATWASAVFLKLKSALGYIFEYAYFTSACFAVGCYVWASRGFDVIHVHNPPDTLFLVGLPFRLLGKKFVFDHHDLCPELYQSRYGAGHGFYSTVLSIFEWCSLKLASVTIATNETYKEKQIQRAGKRPDQIFVVRNGPNQDRMEARKPAERLRRLNKTILCYIGSLNPQDGVDYLLRSLSHLRWDLQRNDFYCVIMGSGDSLEDLRTLAQELKLGGVVELTGFISDEDLMQNLAAADICVDPDPSSPLNDVSTWIKIMEYMACGKPIVSFDLKETRFSAQDAALFVPPNDELAFAHAIVRLMDDPALRQSMGDFGHQRVERELQWSVTGQNLLAAYHSLFPQK